MLLAAIILQNLVIAAMIVGLCLIRPSSPRDFAWIVSGCALLLVGLMLGGVWVFPPRWGAVAYTILFLLAVRRSWRRTARPGRSGSLVGLLVSVVLAAGGLALTWQGLAGRMRPSDDPVALVAPLTPANGFCVLSGGASIALNLHYIESGSTAASFEKHSVDFIRKSRWGFRTTDRFALHPKPAELDAYAVFNAPVRAPCSGEVIEAVDDRPDQPPGHRYRSRAGANLVTLQCGQHEILMAHFRPGTVAVEAGDRVIAGTYLGDVGNSGNTEEPHLHIHAQQRLTDGTLHPVPMLFDGRYLSRGDCL